MQPFRKTFDIRVRRLGNRSRQERWGRVRDGTVSELHPRSITLGAMAMGVKQYNANLQNSHERIHRVPTFRRFPVDAANSGLD